MWLLCHDAILSNENHVRRHIAINATCSSCQNPNETSLHIVRDCHEARRIWLQLLPSNKQPNFFSLDLKHWILTNIANLGEAFIFAMTCWWLWRWRNERSFSPDKQYRVGKTRFILQQVENYIQVDMARQEQLGSKPNRKKEILVSWQIPPIGQTKLNCDGAAHGCPGKAVCGGVIRDQDGNLLRAFTKNLRTSTAIHAEMQGLLCGLQLTWSMGIRRMQVEIDSHIAFDWIMENEIPIGPCYSIAFDCRELINRYGWNIVVRKIFREANSCADYIANLGTTLGGGINYFVEPPRDLLNYFVNDLAGVSMPRMINEWIGDYSTLLHKKKNNIRESCNCSHKKKKNKDLSERTYLIIKY